MSGSCLAKPRFTRGIGASLWFLVARLQIFLAFLFCILYTFRRSLPNGDHSVLEKPRLSLAGASSFPPLLLPLIRLLFYPHFDQNAIPIKQQESCSLFLHDIPACYNGLRSPYRPLSATEDGDQSRRIPYLSEAWTFWPRKEAAGVADAMIKASCNMRCPDLWREAR